MFLRKKRNFSFDFCFDSTDPNSEQFASQETVYSALGQDILDNAFKGWKFSLKSEILHVFENTRTNNIPFLILGQNEVKMSHQ